MRAIIPAAAAAATTNTRLPAAHRHMRLTKVEYIPNATMTGAAAGRRLQVVNRGQDPPATGTKVVAQLDLNAGTVVAGVQEARDIPLTFASLPAASATAHQLAEGDVLELISSPLGGGMADPGGQLITTEQ
jgi:hypothetical protein